MKKTPDTSSLVKKTDYNTKIAEIESRIRDISNLGTRTALISIENEIPNVSNLVKKTNYNTKVIEIENKLNDQIHDKYITTPEFNTLAGNAFNARLAQTNLVKKTDFDEKLSNLNRKITKNKTDHLLVQKELKKLKTFDLGYFIGKNYFGEDGAQNYLVFQPLFRYFKVNNNTNIVLLWKSKGLSDNAIKPPSISNNSLAPKLNYYYPSKIRVKFTGSYLKQHKVIFNHGKVVNIYIVYQLDVSTSRDSDPTIKKCLFGAVTLTKDADIDKYRYSGYGTGFDRRSSFSYPGGGFGQNIIIGRHEFIYSC